MSDRKFCVWEWNGEAEKRAIEVRMKWGSESWKDLIKTPATTVDGEHMPIFYAQLTDPNVLIESGDLRELAKKVVGTLEDYHRIEWGPKLIVSINEEGPRFRSDPETDDSLYGSLAFNVREASEGVTPKGEVYHRYYGYGGGWTHSKGTLADACKGPDEQHRYRKSLVPDHNVLLGIVNDTPENRGAIKNLTDQLNRLRQQLLTFMKGDDALQAALKLGATRQLLSPE